MVVVCMRKIRTINGKYIKVSDCDYEFLRQFRWRKDFHGYFSCSQRGFWLSEQINNKRIHQFVMLLNGLEYPEGMSIDHVDQDPSNNTHENLRFATDSSQNWNKGVLRNNTTGLKGVYPYVRGRWMAKVGIEGQTKYLGIYETKEEAYAAYVKARADLEEYEPTWSDLQLKRCIDLDVTRRVKSSKFIGVTKAGNRWEAFIHVNKRKIHLGSFGTQEQASKAVQKAKQERDTTGVVTPHLKPKSSKYPGVHKSDKKWRSAICINDRRIHLGMFDTEELAHKAHQTAKRELCQN